MNPYAYLGAGALWVASVASVGWFAYSAGKDAELATQAREDQVAQKATDAAAKAAAAAISKIEVRNVTINRELERVVQTNEVFRDCRSGPDALRLLNATSGVAPDSSVTPGGGELPASGAAR